MRYRRTPGLVAILALLVTGVATVTAENDPPQAPAPAAEPAVAIVTLRDAAATGALDVRGFDPRSYRRVHLQMKNRTNLPLAVDICGSHLEARPRRSCQRLGLGPPVTPREGRSAGPGTVVIDLKPGEERTLEVNTCCLDAGTPAPRAHEFHAAREALPPVREKVLRWWADNPEAPQSAVNRAIWQFRAKVVVTKHDRPTRSEPFRLAAAHAGTYYLVRGTELMARDPDGIERFLGTGILAVHPTDTAVFAVALGAATRPNAPPPVELWRLLPTGEKPWQLVCPLPDEVQVLDVRVGPTGHILVLASNGLYRADPARKRLRRLFETDAPDNLSVRFRKDGQAEVTMRRRADRGYHQGGELKGAKMPVCELWRFDLVKDTRERIEEFWNVSQVRVGDAGIYALTGGGKMRRWQGRSFKNISGRLAYERILHVGRKYVWLVSQNGNVVATDAAGRRQFASGPYLRRVGSVDWDAHTDEAVYPGYRGFYKVKPDDGRDVLIVEDARARRGR